MVRVLACSHQTRPKSEYATQRLSPVLCHIGDSSTPIVTALYRSARSPACQAIVSPAWNGTMLRSPPLAIAGHRVEHGMRLAVQGDGAFVERQAIEAGSEPVERAFFIEGERVTLQRRGGAKDAGTAAGVFLVLLQVRCTSNSGANSGANSGDRVRNSPLVLYSVTRVRSPEFMYISPVICGTRSRRPPN